MRCQDCRNRCHAEDGSPFCGITLCWIDEGDDRRYCPNCHPVTNIKRQATA